MTITVSRPFEGRLRYWNTCGWTDSPTRARRYLTVAEARGVVDRIAKDGLIARVNINGTPQYF